VPRIAEFYGIVIAMFYLDHMPPHFHVVYGEHRATVTIEPVAMQHGSLPPRAERMVVEWAMLHRAELWENWDRARRHEELLRIAPLD
jgi:uncharacterized protein DUF4160